MPLIKDDALVPDPWVTLDDEEALPEGAPAIVGFERWQNERETLIKRNAPLGNIEGLGRELYPQLDLWKTAHPVLKRWMDEQVGPSAMLDDLRLNLPQIRQSLRQLPMAIRQLAEQASSGSVKLDMESPELRQIRAELAGQRRQRYWLTVAATSIITGALVVTLEGNAWLGVALLALGGLAAIAGRPGK